MKSKLWVKILIPILIKIQLKNLPMIQEVHKIILNCLTT